MATAPSNNFDFQNYFSATLQSDITSGSLSLTLDNVPTPVEGILILEPDSSTNREIIFYTGKTASTVTLPSDGRGWDSTTATAHLTGSTVIMAPTAYMLRMLKSGSLFDSYSTGWTNLGQAPNAVVANGNHSYTLTFPSTVAASLSPGMRLRSTRTVAAPTQMTSLNGTTQYWTKTTPNKLTANDNFTLMAYIYPTAYQLEAINGRLDATNANGWYMGLSAAGQLFVSIFSGGVANTRAVTSYQSVPLNKKSHVAVTWAAGVVTMYIDGISIPVQTAATGGTAPTVSGAGGDYLVGKVGTAAQFFAGKFAQAAMFNAVLSGATILGYISQGLSGSETNLQTAHSFNGVATDLNTTTPNDLTAGASAGYVADSPFGGQADGTIDANKDYAIVTRVATTSVTCQVPEGCTIPTTGGVTSMTYSVMKAPYQMPIQKEKWRLESLYGINQSTTVVGSTWTALTGLSILLPIGCWSPGYEGVLQIVGSTSVADGSFGLGSTNPPEGRTITRLQMGSGATVTFVDNAAYRVTNAELTAATTYNLYGRIDSGVGTLSNLVLGSPSVATSGPQFKIFAENAFL